MVLAAVLLTIMSGFAIPLESFLTGQLFNIFISFNAAEKLFDTINSTRDACKLEFVQQLLSNTTNKNIFCDAREQGNVIYSASMFVCDPLKTVTDEVTTHSLYFVYLAVGVFVTYSLANTLWMISAARQSRRIRIAFYRATLQHEIGWFETNDVSRIGPQFIK